MYLSITSITLKKWYHFFKLSSLAMGIVSQVKKNPKAKAMKNKRFGGKHYTMSLWEDVESMQAFVKEGAHAIAMKKGNSIAKEFQFYHFESDEFLDWKEAAKVLNEKGRTVSMV